MDRVYGYHDYIAELTKAGPCGCLVGIFSQELWQSHPELRADCEVAFTGWAERLERLLEDAKIRHAPTARFDPRSHVPVGGQKSIRLGAPAEDHPE